MQRFLSTSEIRAYKKVILKGEEKLTPKEKWQVKMGRKKCFMFVAKRIAFTFPVVFITTILLFDTVPVDLFFPLVYSFIASIFCTIYCLNKIDITHGLPNKSYRFSQSSSSYTSPNGASHNPATGLSMMSSSMDVGGNAFGSSSSSISSSSSYRGF